MNNSSSYRWWVLVTVSIANFSAALDTSIVIVSFPRLTEVFNTDSSVVIWLVIAFSIAELGLLLTLAKIGDTIGRKKVYITGLTIYTVGLVLCSISPNMTVLIISRVIQGAGAAVAITLGSAILVAVFPREQHGRAIGLFTILTMIGLIAGPALGGVIMDALDWPGIFYTRIPIGIISVVMVFFLIKEQKEPDARLHLDFWGALTLLGGTSALLLYINLGGDWGYLSTRALVLAVAAIVLLGAFFYIERKAVQPVLDLGLFKHRIFTMASLTNLVQMLGGSTGPVMIPFYVINGLQLSQSTLGLLMALIAVPPMIVSPISGWISDKIGPRIPMVIAMVFSTVAFVLLTRLNIDSTILHISLVLAVFGIGMGMFMAPNQSAVISSVPSRNFASAMGVSNTLRMLGATIGTTAAGTLYARQQIIYQDQLTAEGIHTAEMIERLSAVDSFQFVMILATIVSAVSIVTAAMVGKPPAIEDDSA